MKSLVLSEEDVRSLNLTFLAINPLKIFPINPVYNISDSTQEIGEIRLNNSFILEVDSVP